MMAFGCSEMIGYKANGHMWGGGGEGQLKKTMEMDKNGNEADVNFGP